VLDIYPPSQVGQVMAIWGAGAILGPILGPVLGGWLTDDFSWRWVFFINLPIGILAFAAVWFFMSKDKGGTARPFDFVGFGALVVFIGGMQLVLDRGPTLDSTESEWQEILDTNLMGVLRACQTFGRQMLQRGYGRIINITALNAFVALHEVAAYAVSKAAVQSLTKSLAIEWAGRGVCVNAIAPGVFPTALNSELLQGTDRGRELLIRTPMKRFGNADELVGAAILLASDAASFMTGSVVTVDGGFLASGVNQ